MELLEPRIAPAVFNVGFGSRSLKYDDAPFIATDSVDADPAVTAIFGLAADHDYMPLKTGDLVRIAPAVNAGYDNFIQGTGGRVLAFFYDTNANGVVEQSELSGFSISDSVGLRVSGTVNGDSIANLDTKTGLMSATDLTVATNSIRLLEISNVTVANLHTGVIAGDVGAGGAEGSISKVTVTADPNGFDILAGNGGSGTRRGSGEAFPIF